MKGRRRRGRRVLVRFAIESQSSCGFKRLFIWGKVRAGGVTEAKPGANSLFVFNFGGK